ncbi:MAG TPA: Hsp33 family molecular chaperone HslO [Proteus sp.]|uniref:33 kDa chaperonin n=1 Tax=Proteus hauseri ATCC 700826 TaxID=1354271 RepID=A0AAJ3LV78_PROHU|nr:Hsp33 family molecular chaperone HslO [Proteus hauseri]OAT50899.1 Hsp33 family heat shock protein/chaperonin [Proteus hauseri ATCC 700826]HCH50457.1 Hsp33 family molecular chaperone HslO [Proteus sp. (in: enterobacteria)]
MSKKDSLSRFLFEKNAVRGEIVNVTETYQSMLENHHYPEPVQCLLGDLLVATSLLTATLKFEGDITVQLQGDGPVRLVVINGNNNQQMRGVARVGEEDVKAGSTLKEMIGNGFMVITVTPKKGERYQGIVALDGETIEACIDNYFKQSEQLPTQVFIRSGMQAGKAAAAGMLLQVLPATEEHSVEQTAEHFELLTQLTHTIKAEELFTLDTKEILHRLYHEEDVTLYEPQRVEFRCTCSRERCEDTLVTLSEEDVNHLLQEQGNIDMECEYCGTHYIFNEDDVKNINKLDKSELH